MIRSVLNEVALFVAAAAIAVASWLVLIVLFAPAP